MAVVLGTSPAPAYDDSSSTTLSTASFTPASGTVIVAKVCAADAGGTINTPTATGLTFTSRVNVGTASSSTRAAIFTAAGAGSAVTVTATFAGSAVPHALVVEVWTGAQLAATPAVGSVAVATGAPSGTITTAAANSVVTWISDDWAAVDGTTRTYRSSATEVAYHRVTGQHTLYTAYQQAVAAGSQTVGLTAPVGQTYTIAAIEIQVTGGAAAAVLTRRFVGQAMNRSSNF
jgi:hypothetical protein